RKTYIVIDTHANFLELRTADSVLFRAPCSTGSGGELVDSTTGRHWEFRTPHGVFQVQNKLVQPWWRKPDWAFVEEGEPIPKNPADRFDSDVLGDYALGFGDGYFIHGTLYTRLIGINVTHGCVRLADEDLKWLYERAPVGTPIYIF
ncbi:L,D-transpeptidase, partial [bacterium]|nr:L,D-transpeptidase [bacterium]